jgi:phosphonate transport system ATP-binding protein
MTRADSVIFELNNVTHSYGAGPVLSNVSLRLRAGERVALVGPSGAGKSTLLGLLSGALRPTHGEARILGREFASLSPADARRLQRQIGSIYQQLHLVDNLRVIHNVNAGRLGYWPLWKSIVSLIWPLDTERAAEALAQVGIAEKLYERTDSLSGGQQQRVAIARVLAQHPAAILADEPISNIDPERSREIMDLLRDLCLKLGKTLVVSLHAIGFARSHFQRVVGLRAGRVVFDLPPADLRENVIESLYRIDKDSPSFN